MTYVLAPINDELVFDWAKRRTNARIPIRAFIAMTEGYWLFKVGIVIIATPFVYLLAA